MAEKQRSPFAQALYDLMIVPGIYPIEEWCFHMDPWVKYKTGTSTIHTWGPEAHGAPKTMALIQSWFDDKALPSGEHLFMILSICEDGNLATFMDHVRTGMKADQEFDDYCQRYQKGAELQKKALEKFYEVIDDFMLNVTPIEREGIPWIKIFPIRISGLMFEPQLKNIYASLTAVPSKYRQNVIVKIREVLNSAEKNNWYEPTSINKEC